MINLALKFMLKWPQQVKQMLVRPICVQSRSLRHRQSGNILVSKLMKMTRLNQHASFVLKRSLLLEETLQTFNGNLRDHHPVKAQEVEKQIPKRRHPATPQGQPSISQAFSKMQRYERGGKQWQKLTNSIANCLAKDMMSLYTVEKSGFKQLLNDFDPKYDIRSRKYFSQQAIPKLYNEAKEGVLRQIQNILPHQTCGQAKP